ncbi:TPA: hypothetical protein U5E08_003949 [Yersinia enterocolitica]|nr:hypothetical protein [Yersinia enterocolitica]
MSSIKIDRNLYPKIISDFLSGNTLQEISQPLGVSRERIRQILEENGLTGKDGGVAAKVAKRIEAKEKLDIQKYGCTKEQIKQIQHGYQSKTRTPFHLFKSQRSNARVRGVEWNLLFWDWWMIWKESGHWERRGRGIGHYCMCRKEDLGAYEKGNVYIDLSPNNSVLGRVLGFERGTKQSFVYRLIKAAGGPAAVSREISVDKNYMSQLINRNEIPHSWLSNSKAQKLADLTAGSFTYEQILEEKAA